MILIMQIIIVGYKVVLITAYGGSRELRKKNLAYFGIKYDKIMFLIKKTKFINLNWYFDRFIIQFNFKNIFKVIVINNKF